MSQVNTLYMQTEPGREVIDLTYIKIHIMNSTALLSLIGFEKSPCYDCLREEYQHENKR